MQQKAVARLCCAHGIAQDEKHGQDARLGISWGYLMEILPLDHGKFSSSPPIKDPVVWWCPVLSRPQSPGHGGAQLVKARRV